MNKHILLVKKWLDDPDSLTKKQLMDNARDAEADYASVYAARAAAYAAAYYVKKYEEITEGE